MNLGNTNLVEYGILNDESDFRAHVGMKVRHVFWYKTDNGKDCVRSGKYEDAKARQGEHEFVTAVGKKVPPQDIAGCHAYGIPDDLFSEIDPNCMDTTTEKGRKAVLIVTEMIKRGIIPLQMDVIEITDRDLQIKGMDIFITVSMHVQVKCDWNCGPKEWGGTGNLYLQTHECNPYRRH